MGTQDLNLMGTVCDRYLSSEKNFGHGELVRLSLDLDTEHRTSLVLGVCLPCSGCFFCLGNGLVGCHLLFFR